MATRALLHSHSSPLAFQSSGRVTLNSDLQQNAVFPQSRQLKSATAGVVRAELFTQQPKAVNPVTSQFNRSITRAAGSTTRTESSKTDVAEVAEGAVPPAVIDDLIAFLQQELPKLFVEGGMSSARFADKVEFEDPITRYDTLAGYLFNIQMLRYLFHPVFILQDTYQSGPAEITTRWTMKMYFWLLPWRPEVVFTGLSIYGIDPRSQQFISHRDVWDSIRDNGYFSQEGLRDLVKQMMTLYSPPAQLNSPKFGVLLRRASYEVRDYPAYQVVQVNSPVQSAMDIWPSAPGTPPSPQVEKLKRYFQGANSQRKTIPEGPLMLSSPPESAGQDRILAIAVPLDADAPTPTDPDLTVGTMPRGTWAAVSFGGLPLVETFSSAAAALRADATSDGLLLASRGAGSDRSTAAADSTATDAVKGGMGLGAAASALVSYPSGSPIPFLKRNEVLYRLENFSLESVGKTISCS
ncbi:unnamed protein product [Closterium sp. Naga37s-1]|nr:unnamed protein product [Closterium sp. Naga37s-1]